MALFESKQVRELKNEIYELERGHIELRMQISELKHQRFMRAFELEEEIIDKIELSNDQKAKLKFIFSIERARAAGVPENKILHSHEEITKFFMSEES